MTDYPDTLATAPDSAICQVPVTDSAPGQPPEPARPGNGKVAQLPKALRDQVNNWLYDGVSYPDIIQRLGDAGKDLTSKHLSEYKKYSHQSWLKAKLWHDEMRTRQEAFLDLLRGSESANLSEVGLQITATQICELLRDLKPFAAKEKIENDPDKYVRIVNSLARISRVLLGLQQHREAAAKTRELVLQKAAAKDAPEKTRDVALARWREFFGHDLIEPAWRSKPSSSTTLAPTLSQPSASFFSSSSPPTPQQNGDAPPPSQPAPVAPEADRIGFVAPDLHAGGAHNGQHASNSDAPVPIKTQNSKIENPIAPIPAPPIENQKSITENPPLSPGRCPACNLPLPPLLKNGERPVPVCPKCGSGLFGSPAWTPFPAPPPNAYPSACDICRQRHKLDPNGLPNPCPQCGLYQLTQPP